MESRNYNKYKDLDLNPSPQAVAWCIMLGKRKECLEMIAKIKFINKKLDLTPAQRIRHLVRLRRNFMFCYMVYHIAKRKWLMFRDQGIIESDLEYLELNHGAGFAQSMLDKGYVKRNAA